MFLTVYFLPEVIGETCVQCPFYPAAELPSYATVCQLPVWITAAFTNCCLLGLTFAPSRQSSWHSLPYIVLRKFNIIHTELLLHLVLPFCPTQAVSRQIALEQQLQTMRETDHMLQVLQENLAELDRQLTSYLTDRVDAFQMPQEAQVFQYSFSLQNIWKYLMTVLSLDLVIHEGFISVLCWCARCITLTFVTSTTLSFVIWIVFLF